MRSSQTGQPVFVVGLVEDKALKVHKAEVFEGGDQTSAGEVAL